ncbi:MAG: hypothetical protein GY700_13770 [Propionibacteriaceae bacterium]|nr:hypothetical protein [Propionibacteriaceae bacterium]
MELAPYGAVICVNEAITVVPGDWFVYSDPHVPSSHRPLVKPKGICRYVFGDSYGDNADLLDGVPVTRFQDMNIGQHPDYTVIAALGLARHLQAEKIDVFGADMVPEDVPHRGEDRWVIERNSFNRYVNKLAQWSGIEVVRWEAVHGAADAE